MYFSLSVFSYGSRWRELDLKKFFVKAPSKQNEERSKKVASVGKVVIIIINL